MGAGDRCGAHRERDGRRRRRAAVDLGADDVRRTWGIDGRRPARPLHGNVRAVSGTRHAARRGWPPRTDVTPTSASSSSAAAPSRSRPPVRQARKVGAQAIFTGYQPAREIPAFVEAADILASPRIAGTNTPLKIYSYLRAGKPIVATDLLTHTQVLDRETSLLVPPRAGRVCRRDRAADRRAGPSRPAVARSARARADAGTPARCIVARTKHVCDRMAAAVRRTRVAPPRRSA